MSHPVKTEPKVLTWGHELIDDNALRQAAQTSRLPFVHNHVALMPDAHWGKGACIGSVIPTIGAVIPAAVGVDIGCGMIAVQTRLDAAALPDSLDGFVGALGLAIPAGLGQGHRQGEGQHVELPSPLRGSQKLGPLLGKAQEQIGSLGGGNHFVELCLDEQERVWLVLHSGSRGVGNQLAQAHIKEAGRLMKRYFVQLEDPELAYLVQGTKEFAAYITDMTWAQDYAALNREVMMDAALRALLEVTGGQRTWGGPAPHGTPRASLEVGRINCHHNFTVQEHHDGADLWVTRKGAIRAREGDLGVIPGSMGAASYIVQGLGNKASWDSCSHGAGRLRSRGASRRELSVEDFREAMGDRAWQEDKAEALLDEAPGSYKDIEAVMAAQADLVTVMHTLRSVANYKGTK